MTSKIRVLALLLGCSCGPSTRGAGDDDTGVLVDAPVPQPCNKMDFLFVIDNSGSMLQEQTNLADNAPLFAQAIEAYVTRSGLPLDYRIAVTTAGRDVKYSVHISTPFSITVPADEPGDNGEFRTGCGLSRRWIERGDPDVAGTFACRADVGTDGPGAEMPLLGVEWSLAARVADGTNAGFLRDDALLAIVIITDQDDCSRNDDGFVINGENDTCFDPNDTGILPLAHYLGFLDQLKNQRGRWATAVIAGPGPGSCMSSFGKAAEATRMIDFVAQVGQNATLSSLCTGDLATALDEALGTFENACNAFPPIY